MTTAWDRLGDPLDSPLDAEEAMKQGDLIDWNVRKVPLFAKVPVPKKPSTGMVGVKYAAVLDRMATVRREADYLGIVSPSYPVVQNEEQADFLNAVAEESGATFTRATELKGGSRVLIAMRLPGHLAVNGDLVECWVATVNSHDGTLPFTWMVVPTVRGALLNVGDNRFTVGHNALVEDLARHARTALDKTFDYLDGFQRDADQLAHTTVSQARCEHILERQFGAEPAAAAATRTRAKSRCDDIAEAFSDGEEHTAWAGLLALAHWSDHNSAVRGPETERDDVRAYKALMSPDFKNKAMRKMMEVE